jgi:hypothetical protein
MKLRSSLSILLAGSALLANAQFAPGLKAVPKELQKGFGSINPNDGKKYLGVLAGPAFEGRGTGQPGFEKAMDFMADNFKRFGLKPIMPDGSFFQLVDFWKIGTDVNSLVLKTDHYSAKSTEIGVALAGDLEKTAEAVFVSANGTIASLTTEQEDQVKGKIVVLLNKSSRRRMEGMFVTAGAAGVVSIVDKVSIPTWQGRRTKPDASTSTARLSITLDTAKKLFGEADQKVLTAPLEKDSLVIAPLSASLSAAAKTTVEKARVGNVVAKLEGSDPALKDEFIGVGAHLDHLGKNGDVWYPGADDDGSGSTALLQVVKALTSNPVKPKRTVIFMSFYGEEMGLLGSGYFSNNPPINLTKMIAELQMDMVGRNSVGAQNGDQKRIDIESENLDTIRLVGSKRISTALDKIILAENESIGWKFKYDAEDVYTRSDHYNFARKGIPIAFFFTGFHPDYHQPTDTVDKINFDKIANTAKLVYLTIHQLGDYKGMLPHDVPQTPPANGRGGK